MKFFVIFMIIPICFVGCDEEFGQRISKTVDKTNSTNKESVGSGEKDLDTHESYRSYEYIPMAPIEVQTHYPKVIAEEHTLHELPAHSLRPELAVNEPIILTDNSHDYGSTSKSLYGAQRMPKLVGTQLPIYRDDPKDHSKGYHPIPLKPALPMNDFSQVKPDESDEIQFRAHPLPFPSAPQNPYPKAQIRQMERNGYSTNFNDIEPGLSSYLINKIEPLSSHRPHYHSHRYSDHIPGIPGKPWKDYPIYDSIPITHFKCRPHSPGFFADVEAGCQVWHYCQLDGRHDRFLCSNGTLFNQKTRVCDWWYNVDCHSSVLKYGINSDLYREPLHKKYLPSYNPINQLDVSSKPIPRPPVLGYYASPEFSGHGLAFAESQSMPQKIKRVRKVRPNKSNSTEPELLGDKNKKSVQ